MNPAGAPIWPTFNPFAAIICRKTELPLIWPFTEAVGQTGIVLKIQSAGDCGIAGSDIFSLRKNSGHRKILISKTWALSVL